MSSLPTSQSASFPVPCEVSASQSERAKALSLALLERLSPLARGNVGVRLWDGTAFPDGTPRKTTIVLKHPGALKAMFASQDALSLAETYLLDVCDVEGDWNAMFDLGEEMSRFMARQSIGQKLALARLLFALPKPHPPRPRGWRERARLRGKRGSIERAKEAVAYHYNVPTEFYAAFLDRNMAYSCALWESDSEELASAQLRKFDFICRTLELRPGQKLLDVGCGWGGFLIYAAQNYGVEVTGITLSESQAEEANRRIADAGLSGTCRVLLQDYREVDGAGSFDAIASIEMFEHVGRELLRTYFSQARNLLNPVACFQPRHHRRNRRRPQALPQFHQAIRLPRWRNRPHPRFHPRERGVGLRGLERPFHPPPLRTHLRAMGRQLRANAARPTREIRRTNLAYLAPVYGRLRSRLPYRSPELLPDVDAEELGLGGVRMGYYWGYESQSPFADESPNQALLTCWKCGESNPQEAVMCWACYSSFLPGNEQERQQAE